MCYTFPLIPNGSQRKLWKFLSLIIRYIQDWHVYNTYSYNLVKCFLWKTKPHIHPSSFPIPPTLILYPPYSIVIRCRKNKENPETFIMQLNIFLTSNDQKSVFLNFPGILIIRRFSGWLLLYCLFILPFYALFSFSFCLSYIWHIRHSLNWIKQIVKLGWNFMVKIFIFITYNIYSWCVSEWHHKLLG